MKVGHGDTQGPPHLPFPSPQAWLWVSPEDFLEEASLQEALAVTGCLEEAAGTGLDSPGQEPLVGGPETSLDTQRPPGPLKEDSRW